MARGAEQDDRMELTDRQKKSRRARNIALALVLGAFVVVLYVGTWAKFGANILNRPL